MKVIRERYLRQLSAKRHIVVNRAPGKLYIQAAWKLPTEEKREQELLPLRRSGDFFAKIIVTEGLQPPMKDKEGIVHVGVIPFLLDESILDTALETAAPNLRP